MPPVWLDYLIDIRFFISALPTCCACLNVTFNEVIHMLYFLSSHHALCFAIYERGSLVDIGGVCQVYSTLAIFIPLYLLLLKKFCKSQFFPNKTLITYTLWRLYTSTALCTCTYNGFLCVKACRERANPLPGIRLAVDCISKVYILTCKPISYCLG